MSTKQGYLWTETSSKCLEQDDSSCFVRNGFKSCGADQCVCVKSTNKGSVYVGLYVDDMIIAARTSEEINQVKDVLKNAFKMKELDKAKFILGMKIDHDRSAGTLMIKQTRYIDDVVKRFGQQDAKSVDKDQDRSCHQSSQQQRKKNGRQCGPSLIAL